MFVRTRILLVLVVLALWPCAAMAQQPASPFTADTLQITVDQQPLTFAPQRVNGNLYVRLDDPALPSLLTECGASFTWSEDGTTLVVHEAGGDATWDVAGNTGTVRGQAVAWPGGVIKQDGKTLMRVDTLVSLLGLTLVPQLQQGCFVLLPTITDLKLQTDGGATNIVFNGNGRLSWEADTDAVGHLVIRFPNTVCALPQGATLVGDVQVLVHGKGGVGQAAEIELDFPDHWKGTVGSRLIMDQCVVHEVPDFSGYATLSNTSINALSFNPAEGSGCSLQFDGAGPFAWAWRYNGTDTVVLDLLHVTPASGLAVPTLTPGALIQSLETQVMETDAYPITRYTIKLTPGTAFAFQKVDADPVKTLRFIVGPRDSVAMAQPNGLDGFMQMVHGCIVLDPGHGGSDPGCHSPFTGVQEKDVTLDICLKMRKELEARGWKVLLTRDDDRDLTWPHSPDALELGARANVANNHDADLFVSVHCNASTSSSLRGTTIHWFKSEDYPLASLLKEALGDSLGVPMEGLVHSRFYVLRHTVVPSILVETAFLTNPTDGQMLSDDNYRTQVAARLTDALCQYMTRQSRINGTHSLRFTAPASSLR